MALKKDEVVRIVGNALIKVADALSENDDTPGKLDTGEIAELVVSVVTDVAKEYAD